jgi:hypothetical protein
MEPGIRRPLPAPFDDAELGIFVPWTRPATPPALVLRIETVASS